MAEEVSFNFNLKISTTKKDSLIKIIHVIKDPDILKLRNELLNDLFVREFVFFRRLKF